MAGTTDTTTSADSGRSPGAPARVARLLAAVYFVLAAVGLVGTWYFNLQYSGASYLGDWFANAASSSAAVDLIVIVVVASVFSLREGIRLGWRWPLLMVFIPLSIGLAVAFAFPLFLGLRELRLARDQRDEARAATP